MKNIRNFCIIAHIDHGKSTLADRLLEYTQTIKITEGQMLDDMDLERERGITIKSHAIQMEYTYEGEKYILNLIDTPGHVDFSYEVSRSIAACEGALLVVDASQGVQAQTISNLYMALEHDLEIIPVMNKCDMDSAMPEEVEDEIIDLLGCKREEIIRASGKTGMGVEEILKAVIERIPCPTGDENAPLQALIFDSVFNSFRGIIAYFKVENGIIRTGDHVKFFNTEKEYDADEVGVLKMDLVPRKELRTGDVGYIISGIKTSREVKVGDTITHVDRPCEKAIAGFEEVKPMVFAGVYPIEAEDYENLRSSLEKLQLNDASLTFQPESSLALGFGFRCGFLGLLHMEIIQERLDREFNMNVITTVPNVSYMVYDKQHRRTLHRRVYHHYDRLYRPDYDTLLGETRRTGTPRLYFRQPCGTALQNAAGRNRHRFLRQAEKYLERICFLRLPHRRLPPFKASEAGHPVERRTGGCLIYAHPCRQCLRIRKTDV